VRAPRRGDGADFDPAAPYRMYHGADVPGFPQHPHRGFETLTVALEGLVDHADSLGAFGRYGEGDLQWMSAGRGVVHQELFPLAKATAPNTLRLYQIWLNLHSSAKLSPPAYTMHWAERVARVAGEGGAAALVYAGALGGAAGCAPPAASWAADAAHDVGVFVLQLPPGASFTLPPAAAGARAARAAYVVAGDGVRVGGGALHARAALALRADRAAVFSAPAGARARAQVLLLQGVPIGEPVAQRGPFVMNTAAELAAAFADYRRDGFGGWPHADEEVVFARGVGRFAARRDAATGVVARDEPPGGGAVVA